MIKRQFFKGLRVLSPLGLLAAAGVLTACGTFRPTGALNEEKNVQISGSESASQVVLANIAKPYKSSLGDVPLDDHKLTQQWINYFQGRGRKYMQKYLERSSRYLPMMKNTLREHGLPEDLVYVSLIESGFSPLAHSSANAVGYWQFIRATGKRYGLTVDGFIDERRDPVLATRAAAEHFRDLYNAFGSWHLALGAYNAGESRIRRAVVKYRTRNFWELISHRRSLASETKHYVPKFIAATMIAKDPVKYGFTDIEYQAPLAFETLKLSNPISLSKLAENIGVDAGELKYINPKFRGDYAPKYRGDDTMIRVPVGKMAQATAALEASFMAQPVVVHSEHYFYRVRRGDNLSMIAHRHRTSVAKLRRLNNLTNRSLLRVGQRLRVPDRGGSYINYETSEQSTSSRTSASVDVHVVRRGENLTTIARRYGITVAELRELNQLSQRSILRVGQALRVRAEVGSTTTSDQSKKVARNQRSRFAKNSEVARKVSVQVRKHRVRRGETLSEIAEKYQVSVRKIVRRNSIKNQSRLLAGSELIIPVRN